ncbi:adult cuticle protein 1-like [Condylostylus longicornis]|uniref:adult cuticle protein 1-like n=1 Tax=Condylostylus longicornis TaxID=2530218 RepID=UPI00244E012A|nr:adult cuticle protein 1-like [Condylostylus longicornis]
MKFFCAIVVLALAVGTQASVIPWGAWDDGQWHGDIWGDHGHWDGAWAHPAVLTPGIALAQGGHGAAVVHAPAIAVHAPAVAVHGASSYVAKTRGAVHTAPLAGHIASVSSVNVAPAPGTH